MQRWEQLLASDQYRRCSTSLFLGSTYAASSTFKRIWCAKAIHNVSEFQVRHCAACWLNQEVNMRFLKLYWQKSLHSDSLMTAQRVTDCSLWRWAGQDYSLCEEPGAVSPLMSKTHGDVTMYESSLICMLNNHKLICKGLYICDCSKRQSVSNQCGCQLWRLRVARTEETFTGDSPFEV